MFQDDYGCSNNETTFNYVYKLKQIPYESILYKEMDLFNNLDLDRKKPIFDSTLCCFIVFIKSSL